MRDFQRFLGIGCGIGIAGAFIIMANRLESHAIETILIIFVTGITLAILVFSFAIFFVKLKSHERSEPQFEMPTVSLPSVSIPTFQAPPSPVMLPERTWEFKDGSEQHILQLGKDVKF